MKLPILALCVALFWTGLANAAERHLFILSGQSNMAGLPPERAFLPEVKKLLPGATIDHVKFARGGQPIRKWVKTWDGIAAKHDLEAKKDPAAFYQQLLEQSRAKFAAGRPDSITFLWMQGERDAKTGLAAAYQESLQTLIANLRKDLNAPKMRVVIGRLSDHLDDDQWNAVRAAQVAVAERDPHGAWVDTDDTNDKERNGKAWNDLHYTKEGYDLFGRRLARQAVRLIQEKEPDPMGQPE